MTERATDKVELTWRVRPFHAERAKGISALAVVAGAIYASFVLGGLVIGLFAALILVGGVGPFFVSTSYRLTPDRVEVRSAFQRTARPWRDFRQAYVGERGVSLSPFRGRHPLEPYRSVMLRYGEHRDEILDWVRRFGPGGDGE